MSHTRGLRRSLHPIDGGLHDGIGIDDLGDQPHFAESNPGMIQQIGNHLRLDLGIAFDGLQAIANLFRQIGLAIEHGGPT